MLLKLTSLFFFICLLFQSFAPMKAGDIITLTQMPDSVSIPTGGNTWASKEKGNKCITKTAIEKWSFKDVEFKTYFRTTQKGSLFLKLTAKSPRGSRLLVTIRGVSKEINIASAEYKIYEVGEWDLPDTGYVAIHIKGIEKHGNYFADIREYKISGSAINNKTAFVKNDEGNFFYWGRRGPSVHLKYNLPANTKAKWFYNEVTVPVGQDVIGSYFMADGFSGGYFGMQVNSKSERRILFSVWSPFSTDDPKKIPQEYRITMLKKGEGVYAGAFGNEGSGGQSYLRYNWKAGITYRFLIGGTPDGHNNTVFTAYFFDPEKGIWTLIASFLRPMTDSYLTGLHSFLENFIPEGGDKTREVLFGNQWVCDENGNWLELTKAVFTYDNTAAAGYRMDYAGGISGNCFYLKNCGFFNTYTPYKTLFERMDNKRPPQINFDGLP